MYNYWPPTVCQTPWKALGLQKQLIPDLKKLRVKWKHNFQYIMISVLMKTNTMPMESGREGGGKDFPGQTKLKLS